MKNIKSSDEMDVTIDVTNKNIKTDRLLLRAWQAADINDFYDYASVAGVGEMAGWAHHESIEATRKVLQSFLAEKNVFAVSYKENGKVIGSVGLHEPWANSDSRYSHLKMKNIGYVLAKEYWGRGLMPEAVAGVIQFCFDEYDLDALTCEHARENRQSKRVIEKCGFSHAGQNTRFAGQPQMAYSSMRYILFRP